MVHQKDPTYFVTFSAMSGFLPSRRISNKFFDPNWVSKIKKHTGIDSRHYATASEAASDLAVGALKYLVADVSSNEPREQNTLVVATTSPDTPSPPTASWVHRKLGLCDNFHCFDIASSCSSFVSGLRVAGALAHSENNQNIFLVSAELKHKILDPLDMRSRPLFGDGACAVRMNVNKGKNDFFMFSHFHHNSDWTNRIQIPVGGSRAPTTSENIHDSYLKLSNNKSLFGDIVKTLVNAIEDLWEKRQKILSENFIDYDVDGLIYLHQANANILFEIKKRLHPTIAKRVPILMADVGNVVSASLPLHRLRLRILEALFLEAHKFQKQKKLLKKEFYFEWISKYFENFLFSTQNGLTLKCTYAGEQLFFTDASAKTAEDLFTFCIDPTELETVYEAFNTLSGPLADVQSPRLDIWAVAGGGFQTIGLLHGQRLCIPNHRKTVF